MSSQTKLIDADRSIFDPRYDPFCDRNLASTNRIAIHVDFGTQPCNLVVDDQRLDVVQCVRIGHSQDSKVETLGDCLYGRFQFFIGLIGLNIDLRCMLNDVRIGHNSFA